MTNKPMPLPAAFRPLVVIPVFDHEHAIATMVAGVVATGVPPGWGEPIFDRLDADEANQCQSIARGAAVGVVIDDSVHALSSSFKMVSTTPAAAVSAAASTAPLRSL